jgi:transposase
VQTDASGVPIGLAVDGANRNDMKMVQATLESIPVDRPGPEEGAQGMCMDKGYDFPEVRDLVEAYHYEAHIRARGEEAKHLAKGGRRRARRWVVERTHGWLNRYRRLLIRWEKKVENYLGLLQFVCGIIAFRAAGVLG